jgi:hypothetical protein
MRQWGIISILLAVASLSAVAQKVDTLYTDLKNPTSFIVVNDAIYILESGNHRVLKLDLNGRLIEKYGNRGGGNYQFDNPVSIASSTGLKIFVSDLGNNRIQVFDKRWQYLSSITGNEKFQTSDRIEPSYLGVNKLSEIIFYDAKSKSLGKYDEDGAYLDRIPLPSDIKSVDGIQLSGDKIFMLDKRSGLIHRLSGNGFYESFYPAEKTDSFFYINEVLFIAQNGSIKRLNRQEKVSFIDFGKKSKIQKQKLPKE